MILSDLQILKEIKEGSIIIDPFEKNSLGSNSYDVHLGRKLGCYDSMVLDSKKEKYFNLF